MNRSLPILFQKYLALLVVFLYGMGHLNLAKAQTTGNEWIVPGNTYYKFKVGREGIYRITKAQLDQINMGQVPGNQFAIFREGRELPVYTTTASAFGSSDYIEFYATRADGAMDTELYPEPGFQPNKSLQIISDTAYYFLTYDNQTHQRLSLVQNNIPSPTPAAAAYCWVTAKPAQPERTSWAAGQSHNFSLEYGMFYSSDFDLAEGYAYNNLLSSNVTLNVPTPQVNTLVGLPSVLNLVVSGHSLASLNHQLGVTVNGSRVWDTAYLGFNMVNRNLNLAGNSLSNNVSVNFTDAVNFYVHDLSLRYPRLYNFSGDFASQAAFQLPAGERYLEITGFNPGGESPRLYDRSNNKIYTGTVSGGLLRYYLDAAGGARDMLLVHSSAIRTITQFKAVNFRDYSIAGNQGNYIILSHKDYINASPSYINDYRAYRNSMSGGGYQAVVVDVTELYDQFGYGFEYHPIAVRKFLQYALQHWAVKPEYLFIVGKGISYVAYNNYLSNSSAYSYAPVPTWGDPGSDNLFSSFNNSQKPLLATGRLSAWNNQEIGNYLEKVKKYEQAQRTPASPGVASEYWKKSALHIAGSSRLELQERDLIPSLNACKTIFGDTLTGGQVTTIRKNTTETVEEINSNLVDSMIDRGVGHITFFGHASSTGFDYNLNSPDNYNASPRFPIFYAYGCNVAYIFSLTNTPTVSEKYINSINGGSIVMVAGDNNGWTSNLPPYMQGLYRQFSFKSYGATLGKQYQRNIEELQDRTSDVFTDIHTQCLLFQGDPAIKVYSPEKPDYAVEPEGLSTNPVTITTALDSFEMRAVVFNLAKATGDSILVTLQHTRPGITSILHADSIRLARLMNSDTLIFHVPIDPTRDIGLNNYTVKVDAGEEYDELSEANNQATLQVFLYSDNLVPVYPKEFAIVYNRDLTLKASTLNAFSGTRQYKLEIDTTENFNSPLKQRTDIISRGGVIKWKPSLNYQDSVVYYWRAAPDSLVEGKYSWTNSSFIFLANGSDGWNQSHYFQYKKNEPFHGLEITEQTGRKFVFSDFTNVLKIENAVVFPELKNYDQVRESLNDLKLLKFECLHDGAIYFVVIDSATGRPWQYPDEGVGGSTAKCESGQPLLREVLEFSLATRESRNNARAFLESVPAGHYVLARNYIYSALWNRQASAEWKADELQNGAGISLYHTLKNMGFSQIDQFNGKKPFIFFTQKGVNGYPAEQVIGADSASYITTDVTFKSYPDSGTVSGQIVGPAKEWQSLKWQTQATDAYPQNDSPYVEVFGITPAGNETLLYRGFSRDTSLSFISAATYPNLRLNWNSVDNITRTSTHLKYWRVLFSPVPEAALNAAALFEFTDTLRQGQKGKLRLAIENLTPLPMDSMLVSFKVIDRNNVRHDLEKKRYKPLAGNDTLVVDLDLDMDKYPRNNFIFVEANPDNDQPEQYHPNNLGYLGLYMDSDEQNPLLDVTFDGIHILDRDIVSAKPFIKILMRDESHFLALNDTALMQVQLLPPGGAAPLNIPLDGTVCKFIPADLDNSKKNEARVEYRPELLEDGVYRLIVRGKDQAGNPAGNAPKYEINFTVENKPSITNVLNYPNPFSTSTQFIFTMTGSEIPSQFKIQILTVTGKVVREIKKQELGHLHIGRNMTEYRWDGKDEYGQLLGNGVYLYRVVTSIRGENVEHRTNKAVDKYFKNGYGKLYIMR